MVNAMDHRPMKIMHHDAVAWSGKQCSRESTARHGRKPDATTAVRRRGRIVVPLPYNYRGRPFPRCPSLKLSAIVLVSSTCGGGTTRLDGGHRIRPFRLRASVAREGDVRMAYVCCFAGIDGTLVSNLFLSSESPDGVRHVTSRAPIGRS